ncbi:MAG: bifunctional pyr operon transcriptional regulator/uracil phosphoribosyltransferase PyrR [bacterium]|nr:bifunctional pyr operon transcriptional regulator/uracil phosphoribosyltransferase PyrR [bacterium]
MATKSELILDEKKMNRAITRLTHEILEQNTDPSSLGIIGILTRGAHLAKRVASLIGELEGVKVPVGLMDISLYRDDVHSKLDQPIVQQTNIMFELARRNVVLIDDVLFTGRTIRAALSQIVDFGRPKTVQLAVLVDRGHRELPIKADFVGVNIPTAKSDEIIVHLSEVDGVDSVSHSKSDQSTSSGKADKKVKPAKSKKSVSKGGKS